MSTPLAFTNHLFLSPANTIHRYKIGQKDGVIHEVTLHESQLRFCYRNTSLGFEATRYRVGVRLQSSDVRVIKQINFSPQKHTPLELIVEGPDSTTAKISVATNPNFNNAHRSNPFTKVKPKKIFRPQSTGIPVFKCSQPTMTSFPSLFPIHSQLLTAPLPIPTPPPMSQSAAVAAVRSAAQPGPTPSITSLPSQKATVPSAVTAVAAHSQVRQPPKISKDSTLIFGNLNRGGFAGKIREINRNIRTGQILSIVLEVANPKGGTQLKKIRPFS